MERKCLSPEKLVFMNAKTWPCKSFKDFPLSCSILSLHDCFRKQQRAVQAASYFTLVFVEGNASTISLNEVPSWSGVCSRGRPSVTHPLSRQHSLNKSRDDCIFSATRLLFSSCAKFHNIWSVPESKRAFSTSQHLWSASSKTPHT